MTRFEIVATLVTFEQENLTSSIKVTFRTIQRAPIERGTSLSDYVSGSPKVLWRDYLIGSFVRSQARTHGIFLWSMRKNSIFYFEVCEPLLPSPDALKPQFAIDGVHPTLYQSH